MKKTILVLIFTLITTFSFSQRKVNTTYLKVKSVKNASVLGTDNRGNVIDKTLDLSNLITVPEYRAGNNITIDKSNPLQPVINANETGGSVTGLEKITENGQTGWRLVGKNPSNYGDIGSKAVDLSDTQYSNSELGATGISSFSTGLNTTASSNYSAAFNRHTKAIGLASAAFNDYTEALASFSFSAGRTTKAYSFAEFSVGMNNTNYRAGSQVRWIPTDRIFNVGNGVNESNKSDAFTVLKNGTITAPSLDISEINNAGGKALVTKEYADATYSSGVTSIVAGTNISIDNTNPLQPIINAAGGGGASTDLTYTAGTSNGIVNSSTGTSATIPLANATHAGLMKANFYEEGTFVPRLEDNVSSNEIAAIYNCNATGRYTRVGNLIHFSMTFSNINTSGIPKGELRIWGFPYNQHMHPSVTHKKIYSVDKISGSDKDIDIANLQSGGSGSAFIVIYDLLTRTYSPLREATFNNGSIVVSGTYRSGSAFAGNNITN
ncbi:hypothetical protein [Tenacibaculum soleae]|uniref:hypothetical protein n=1 Tax=Tenacibaculum soleae TaxID=447689 RepID=UPI002300EDBB|nr:hypothetical protein [Tenacibaculum soleae]